MVSVFKSIWQLSDGLHEQHRILIVGFLVFYVMQVAMFLTIGQVTF